MAFKNFYGFHLLKTHHDAKAQRRKEKSNYMLFKTIKLLAVVAITLTIWLLPPTAFGIEGLTTIEQRVIAVFLFAALMWVLEAIPAWTTSVGVVVLLLLTCSDSSLWFMRFTDNAAGLGQAISYKSLMYCFADPTIMLFIGGFILAIAATKSGLDVKLARTMLRPFGTKSYCVLLGFLLVTAVFSMFISNTATAAMMLAFLAPVLKALPADGKGKIGLALAIPIAANVGGLGTPIGTPPNAIVLKYLSDSNGMSIGFGEWMAFMVPYVAVMLFISWLVLLRLFPFKQKKIELKIEGTHTFDWRTVVVYVTFGVTVLLWLLDKVTGVNANVVAMIPVGVFCLTGVITKSDLEEINWSVLWMFAGGFALGVALNESGLASHMIESIPFETWSPWLILIGSGLLCYAMSNFISNTASAALLVPILAVVGGSMKDSLAPLGGLETLLIGIALSASLAMALPISTPPNALAHATGLIRQQDMGKVGLIIGVIGLALGYLMLVVLGSSGLL